MTVKRMVAAAVAMVALALCALPFLVDRGVYGKVPIPGSATVHLPAGNVDVTLVSRIIDRGLVKDGRMAHLNVRVKDRPGALATLTAALAEGGANIVSLEHRRGTGEVWVTEAEIALTLETRGPGHVDEIAGRLTAMGYEVERG